MVLYRHCLYASWCGQRQLHLLKFKFSLSLQYQTAAKPCRRKLISLQNITWQRQLPNVPDHWTSDILCHIACMTSLFWIHTVQCYWIPALETLLLNNQRLNHLSPVTNWKLRYPLFFQSVLNELKCIKVKASAWLYQQCNELHSFTASFLRLAQAMSQVAHIWWVPSSYVGWKLWTVPTNRLMLILMYGWPCIVVQCG